MKNAYYPQEFNEDGDRKYEFAILELEEDLAEYGYFGIDSSENNFQYDEDYLTLAGYPGV